jgi:hypothetical protein
VQHPIAPLEAAPTGNLQSPPASIRHQAASQPVLGLPWHVGIVDLKSRVCVNQSGPGFTSALLANRHIDVAARVPLRCDICCWDSQRVLIRCVQSFWTITRINVTLPEHKRQENGNGIHRKHPSTRTIIGATSGISAGSCPGGNL